MYTATYKAFSQHVERVVINCISYRFSTKVNDISLWLMEDSKSGKRVYFTNRKLVSIEGAKILQQKTI